jgi:hypothetical protein
MKRRRWRLGPPKLEIPTVLVGVRVPLPTWQRFEAECRRQGKRPGAFLAECIDKALPAQEKAKAKKESTK